MPSPFSGSVMWSARTCLSLLSPSYRGPNPEKTGLVRSSWSTYRLLLSVSQGVSGSQAKNLYSPSPASSVAVPVMPSLRALMLIWLPLFIISRSLTCSCRWPDQYVYAPSPMKALAPVRTVSASYAFERRKRKKPPNTTTRCAYP